jgi:deferrochelatase/peroxidase EfeB
MSSFEGKADPKRSKFVYDDAPALTTITARSHTSRVEWRFSAVGQEFFEDVERHCDQRAVALDAIRFSPRLTASVRG